MKRKVLWGVLFVLVLLTSAVVHLPASLAVRYMPPVPGLALGEVSGTVWKGTAAQLRFQGKALGILKWRFNPLSLLTGKADVEMRLSGNPGVSARGNVGYGFAGLYANNLLVSASAGFVQSFIPMAMPVSLSGQFDLTVRDYQMKTPLCNALAGNLAWTQGNVSTPLGNIEPGVAMATLACDSGKVVVSGDSESQAVETAFNLTLTPEQRYSVSGWFVPGATFPEGMRSQLGWLGQPDDQGRYRFSFNG